MQRKSAAFFFRKEKSNNKILLSLIRPRVFKDSGIFFSSTFPRYRQILGAPRGDILFLVSSACRENALRWFKITRIVWAQKAKRQLAVDLLPRIEMDCRNEFEPQTLWGLPLMSQVNTFTDDGEETDARLLSALP